MGCVEGAAAPEDLRLHKRILLVGVSGRLTFLPGTARILGDGACTTAGSSHLHWGLFDESEGGGRAVVGEVPEEMFPLPSRGLAFVLCLSARELQYRWAESPRREADGPCSGPSAPLMTLFGSALGCGRCGDVLV